MTSTALEQNSPEELALEEREWDAEEFRSAIICIIFFLMNFSFLVILSENVIGFSGFLCGFF